MEQPFIADDMLVPKNPVPVLLSPDTGGPKRANPKFSPLDWSM